LSPVRVVVEPMSWTMTSWLVSGWPRQFIEIAEKSRCSTGNDILIWPHLEPFR